MIVTFKQIRREKNIKDLESGFLTAIVIALAVVLISFLLCLFQISNALIDYAIAIGVIWLCLFYGRKLYPDWPKKRDYVGELSFDETSVIIQTGEDCMQIFYSEICKVLLEYNFVQGKPFAYKDIRHNGLAKIGITTITHQTIECKFLIANIEQLEALKLPLKILYKRKIEISELMGNDRIRTTLLDQRCSYPERQAIKKEMGVL